MSNVLSTVVLIGDTVNKQTNIVNITQTIKSPNWWTADKMAFYTCVQILFLLKSANDRNILNPVIYLLSFVLQAIERTIFLLCLRNVHASHVSSMISVLIFRLNIRRHAKRCSSGGKVRHSYLFKMRSENTTFINYY